MKAIDASNAPDAVSLTVENFTFSSVCFRLCGIYGYLPLRAIEDLNEFLSIVAGHEMVAPEVAKGRLFFLAEFCGIGTPGMEPAA